MTQALINNLDKAQEMLTKSQPKKDLSAVSSPVDKKNFEEIIDSKMQKTEQVFTIADIKNSAINNGNKLANFKEILKKATDETSVENALDLTLARDISEIISQLKEELDDLTQEAQNIPETVEEEASADVVMVELPEQQINTDLVNVDIAPISSQIVEEENLVQENSQNLETTINSEDIIETDINIDVEDAVKVYDKQSAKYTSEVTDSDLGLDEGVLEELNVESITSETEGNTENEGFNQEQSPEELALKTLIEKDKEHSDKKFTVEISTEQELPVSQATPLSREESVVTPTVGSAQPLNATANMVPTQQPTPATEISPSKIIEQIAKQLENMHNTSKVNIVLNPASLGKVTIELAKTAEGMSAQFTVATQEAREILMKGLDGLKESLLSHGVNADNVNVKLNDTQKSEYKQDWTEQEGSRGGNKEQNRQNKEKEKGLFEKMMAQAKFNEDGNV